MAQARSIDVDQLVDNQRITGFNLFLVFWCFIITLRYFGRARCRPLLRP